MRVRIRHRTEFRYSEPAWASFNEVRLVPRNDENQNLVAFDLSVDPWARTTRYRDHFGTQVTAFNIWDPHDHLAITADSTVMTNPRPAAPLSADDLDALDDAALRDVNAEWLHPSPLASGGDHLMTFAQHVRRVVRPHSVAELALGVSREVHKRFAYTPGASFVSSTVDDLLERGTGVCQDFAHLAITALRDLGIPARYVSGYFFADPDPEPDVPIDVDSHAWVEALVPGHGWLEFDPTNDCLADERHVVVAVGRDYGDVAPVRGVHSGGGEGSELDVTVSMVAPSTPISPPVPQPPALDRRLAAPYEQQQQQQQ